MSQFLSFGRQGHLTIFITMSYKILDYYYGNLSHLSALSVHLLKMQYRHLYLIASCKDIHHCVIVQEWTYLIVPSRGLLVRMVTVFPLARPRRLPVTAVACRGEQNTQHDYHMSHDYHMMSHDHHMTIT